MAAPHSVDPVALVEQHLACASPDLLREMIASLANAMIVRASRPGVWRRVRPTQRGAGQPALSWRSRSCARARITRTGC